MGSSEVRGRKSAGNFERNRPPSEKAETHVKSDRGRGESDDDGHVRHSTVRCKTGQRGRKTKARKRSGNSHDEGDRRERNEEGRSIEAGEDDNGEDDVGHELSEEEVVDGLSSSGHEGENSGGLSSR